MYVINMPLEIFLIPDRVLPESSLPKLVFAAFIARYRHPRRDHASRKEALDAPPSPGEIRIIRTQCDDRMQVIRKNDDGIDRKWLYAICLSKCLSQKINMIDKNSPSSICQRNGEEERSARNAISPLMDHSSA